jgi:Spy/CpxP family protein refolding chaperone
MKKWRLIAGVALVFILGAMAGSVGTRLYQGNLAERFWKNPEARKTMILKRLTRELGLREEQQQEFKTIIEEVDQKMEGLHRENRAAIRRILEEGYTRMMERLDPAQQEKLKELKARREERLRQRRKMVRPP